MCCSCILFKFCPEFTTCESGEVGVFASMEYTDVNVPAGQVSWDIQDVDGNVLEDQIIFQLLLISFIHLMKFVCLR